VRLEKRPVFGVGKELILSVNAAWRRMRVFKSQGTLLSDAVAETVTRLEARGWRARRAYHAGL
jgi:hypothetical protein